LRHAGCSSTDHGGGERLLRTANEKGPFGVAKSEEAAPAWTASGTPNPPFPPEWSHHRAILSAKCGAGKGD
jgi:hypothetical protein